MHTREPAEYHNPSSSTSTVKSRWRWGGEYSATINLAAHSRWTGGFGTGVWDVFLVQSAGVFANTSSNVNSNATINADVVGVGKFDVHSGYFSHARLEFVHAVAATQTVAVSGNGSVRIDAPKDFHALLMLGNGEIVLQDLKADGYTLDHNRLSLYSGKTVVDRLALTLQATGDVPRNFGVSQTTTGISIHGNGTDYLDGGTLLGLHV